MEHTLPKEQMDSMKALAETSMKISEAKDILFKLEEAETEYLLKREKAAVEKVEKILIESRGIIDEAHKNHESVKDLYAQVSGFAESLGKMLERIETISKDFTERNIAWGNHIDSMLEEIAEEKKQINTERVDIENTKKSIERKEKSLKDAEAHLNSRQATLETSYNLEKKLWNKMLKTR